MKAILRYYLINLTTLWLTTQILPGLSFSGSLQTLFLGALAFGVINFFAIPILKILLLPLNLLTLGLFAWISNVLALYALTNLIPQFRIIPFHFTGFEYGGFIIPETDFSVLWVAIIASLIIGAVTHFLHWLVS